MSDEEPIDHVDDSVVDRVRPIAASRGFLTTATGLPDGGPKPGPLGALCLIKDWDDARLLAESASRGIPSSTNNQGFGFVDDGTVIIFDPLDNAASVSHPAFARLMTRLLDALISGAVDRNDPIVEADWWPDLLQARRRLSELG